MAAPKQYPDELKARAVRLCPDSGPNPTIRKLAQQLGVHHEALRNWIRRADADSDRNQQTPIWPRRTSGCVNRSPSWSGSTTFCVRRVRFSPRRSPRPGGDRGSSSRTAGTRSSSYCGCSGLPRRPFTRRTLVAPCLWRVSSDARAIVWPHECPTNSARGSHVGGRSALLPGIFLVGADGFEPPTAGV
ncbi:transposase [Nocardia flavorosea]|uniref:transposase n=1 Tax=Nocardia flavorosea TaxID=53429 RepID=UPI0009FBF38A